jgi:hypothetical protein
MGISSYYFWDTTSKKQSTYVWFLDKWNRVGGGGGFLKDNYLLVHLCFAGQYG